MEIGFLGNVPVQPFFRCEGSKMQSRDSPADSVRWWLGRYTTWGGTTMTYSRTYLSSYLSNCSTTQVTGEGGILEVSGSIAEVVDTWKRRIVALVCEFSVPFCAFSGIFYEHESQIVEQKMKSGMTSERTRVLFMSFLLPPSLSLFRSLLFSFLSFFPDFEVLQERNQHTSCIRPGGAIAIS